MTNLKYNITNDDLKLCWKFSVEYFLNPKKDVYDRVAFKKRGLGGIADSFLQKLLEIGVCKIIQKHGTLIHPYPDFEIHGVGETEGDNRTEPDIIGVFRKGYGQEDYEKLTTSIMNGKRNLKILNEELDKLKKTRKNIKLIKDCSNESEKAKTKKEKTSLTYKIKKCESKILRIKSIIQSSEQQLGLWKKETYPRVYVEIKNTAKKDAWIGPKLAEVASIISRKKFKKSDIYYVYSRIVSNGKWDSDEEKNAERRSDPLGVFLKSNLKKNSTLKNFHDVGNLQVEIQNVMTVDDIYNYGTKFPRGTIIPNPNIITIPGQKVDKFGHKDPIPFSEKKIRQNIDNKQYKKVKSTKTLPQETASQNRTQNSKNQWVNSGWAQYPSALGKFTVKGKINLYRDQTTAQRRFWIESLGNVIISNPVIGETQLKKNDIRCYQIRKQGQTFTKQVDDIWISKYNEKLMSQFPASRITEISNKI